MPARTPRSSTPARRTDRRTDRRPSTANHHGIHLLRSGTAVRGLVESAALGPDSLVLDLGAGPGTLTAPLARTGARVLAIERDPGFLARLERRFGDHPNVRVVAGDLTRVPLPGRPFQVVASIPYDLSTLLLRRLLTDANGGGSSLAAADLVIEWGFAQRVSRAAPRDLETAWWGAAYELRVVRRVRAAAFTPAPSVDSAHLRVRPRPGLTGRRVRRLLYAMLAEAFRCPDQPARTVVAEVAGRSAAGRILGESGLDRGVRAGAVPADRWAGVARSALGLSRR
ncbi:23S rRNA (adenine-N6)-dimethyltransferase [Actinopolymorpha cephalotaxi]|uniref:23S rRNA (Adenine-N6)-dimethyltransferase n=1 Tax=Actinopolymorpha cephalotaxi TaxID=504797 RepID=A0A1I2XZK7_9ACTN|nr:rRNA adenine N-6-methyltransferase family protein [Actinopolymorpha cephalotaxi]NYH87251.1 23S rRNA (adenine-N6)-dimethyltransferase [Actinopolymorpha cephalotaxi]SFH18537.1 23S rRNA (adenine-N6)-dimethyltransferase [Actinopolymorpha cephalotaxi]